ncbi:hypothetical protein [Streptomyces sp. MMBL 11-1]|uniref:hypothetical protein n=1 Tax=Streptomyces sp. MMBL 11-1 TaxID=3026420 RepID=UPI0023631058|nr:hypothetical protein [Streptomyces sp. MMBL 11-1]
MATESDLARLRQKYTGEPRAVALEWYRTNGLHQGLVPDAVDSARTLLEAGVLEALIRSPLGEGGPITSGTLCGISAASPRTHGLTLWCRNEDLPIMLGRLLPARTAHGLAGVPGLRPWAAPDQDLSLGLIGQEARITVRGRLVAGTGRGARARARRTGPEDLERAQAWTITAGGTPVWDDPFPQREEQRPLELLAARFGAGEAVRWSRALRRAGLFLEQVPDWRSRPPADEELEGPNPSRLKPRAVGPARTSSGAVVAVTSSDGRGGYGCTTTAVVLAGALARSGNRVLVLGGDDPSNVVNLFGKQPAPVFAGSGSVNVGLLPPDDESAWDMLSRARGWDYDVVILDPGFQRRTLAEFGDLVLAVTPDRDHRSGPLWTETEVIDRRPAHVRMWAWLQEEISRWTPPTPDPAQRLMILLDLMFAVYTVARAEDGDPRVYDPSDAQEVDEWWEDIALVAFGLDEPDDYDYDYDYDYEEDEEEEEGDGDDEEVEDGSPDAARGLLASATPGDAELDTWRADFIRFLHDEGQRRHPVQWWDVAASWPDRHRERQAAGLGPGQRSEEEWWPVLSAFFDEVEDDAVATWGPELWERYRSRWATALVRNEDLVAPFDDLVETKEIRRQGSDIAQDLAGRMRGLPRRPVLGVLARARHDVDARQFNDTAEAVVEHGLGGLTLLPDLAEWTHLWGDLSSLVTPSPRAASTALALAQAVTGLLPRNAEGERA